MAKQNILRSVLQSISLKLVIEANNLDSGLKVIYMNIMQVIIFYDL
jgi:hypothetical protein